ncbi:hypothetical protein [Pseudofrankia asymbiotica]|uniref:Uncharacterized protein n=1 Tax=Pseudofrankia asymbiotica TaxID=1834516 RepID=A0A1V2I583_9ACTN|nr:hypothetical protein [Pseudofrankia asymbiotica]ONH26039.1 hypothetical protein BL253_25820 [Pseudofrankia asymbiotica]
MEAIPDRQEIVRYCQECARHSVLLATGHGSLWECAGCGTWLRWPLQPAVPDLSTVTVLDHHRARRRKAS